MSALSVFKPVTPHDTAEPQAKKVSGLRAKKGKAGSHLASTAEAGQEVAKRWLELNAGLAEAERELALAHDRDLDVIRPWHEETCSRRRAHEASVVV